MVAAPELQRAFGSTYAGIASALLVVPPLVATFLEPPLLWLARGRSRRAFLLVGLGFLAASALAAAAAPGLVTLCVALSVASVASGVVMGLGQSTLMDDHPDERERYLARWTLAGQLGDLGAPVIMGALAATPLGWRGGFIVAAALCVVYALALARQPLPAAPGDAGGDEDEGAKPSLRDLLRNRALIAWAAATALCCLLDEILVVLATLHMRDDLGLGASARSASLAAFVIGGVAGLWATDRLLPRIPPLKMLVITATACAALFSAWVAAPWPWLSAVILPLVGAVAAPLYPLTKAQAYRALPGDSAAVGAASALFAPLDIVVPFVLAWVAEAAGLRAALLVLLLQPLGILAVALRTSRRTRT